MFEKPIEEINGIGAKRAQLFKKLGVQTCGELLYYIPYRYDDWSKQKPLGQLSGGAKEVTCGKIISLADVRPKHGILLTKAVISDGVSKATCVWFNQPFLKRNLRIGTFLRLYGKVESRYNELQIVSPEYEIISSGGENEGRIIPVYSTTAGLDQKVIRKAVRQVLADDSVKGAPDPLPEFIKEKYKLMDRKEALRQIHFPDSQDKQVQAKRRLVFDELFQLQIGLALGKKAYQSGKKGIAHTKDDKLLRKVLQALPFDLTQAQKKAWEEIKTDMENAYPMNRLIQGDVGTGKTIIALLALLKTHESGFQGVMMAPTEILAEQHFQSVQQLLSPFGVTSAILTGSIKSKEKEETIEKIKAGEIDVVVGTHALLQDNVIFRNLSLVITDEQHRFGVRQRSLLQEKGQNPDVLVMTATPIPRTLALTIYGDLNISVIDEFPPGREPVKTYLISSDMRYRMYRFLREQICQGRQAYIVCPLVEESERLNARAAVEVYNQLAKIMADKKIALLHGQLPPDERDSIIRAFRAGQIQVLVSTTVIEVGVNVPNASLMVIENAERFGLAQLHQLRGRVGRGTSQAYCILVSDIKAGEGRERLEMMTRTNNGFLLAEKDLQLRGPGEFLGTRQHGLPPLRFPSAFGDIQLLKIVREEAFKMVFEGKGEIQDTYPLLWRELKEGILAKMDYMKIS